jgi:hypothetical protein
MSSKLNWLVSHTYPGGLVAQKWLSANGISYSLTQKYTESGWLNKVNTGLYCRPDPNTGHTPDWLDAFIVLSKQLHLPVHLAGLSSLNQQGFGHYLQVGEEQVWIGIKERKTLPAWFNAFKNYEWQYSTNSKLVELNDSDFTTALVRGIELKVSTPELAAYEVVDAIGKSISFQHVSALFQGLVNLSPRKVQSILNRSGAVQTNRIFLFLARYYQHAWYKKIDESKVNLGSGKRQVIKGGKLDAHYQITVPESFATNGDYGHG